MFWSGHASEALDRLWTLRGTPAQGSLTSSTSTNTASRLGQECRYIGYGSDIKSPPAITRVVREAAPPVSTAAPGPSASVAPRGRGRAHLLALMLESPRKRLPESGKPARDESSVPVGEVISVAIKGDNTVVPVKASAKRNYLLAKECSTITNSDIPFDGLSELFSDTFS